MLRFWIGIGLLGLGVTWLCAQEDKPAEITTVEGQAGDLLRTWWKEKTAAGNDGDWYENRDEGHSPFDLKPFPQIKSVVFTDQEKKTRANWAAARIVRPHVTFGNSSTSAPPLMGGSNPRQFYTQAKGLKLLHEQYVGNNIYVYPEHLDHDPGRLGGPNLGPDGMGDLYPTNTPYVLISQGSSYTDQPFLKAIAQTLAAFRPEVKKRLVKEGLLMPTLQMVFRSSQKTLKAQDDYLTGLAHPSVFDGSQINPVAMVQAAHSIRENEIPPLVTLEVLEETVQKTGKDYFDPASTEILGTTPSVIARVFRGAGPKRKMVVSASKTRDPNGRDLKFHWVLLRGDPDRVAIKPREGVPGECGIEVSWQKRRPTFPGSPIESNRVDIGVIAHNGVHFSAPSFITWFFLDNEDRLYDEKGRMVQWAHNQGGVRFEIDDWSRVLDHAATPSGAQFLGLTPPEVARVKELSELYRDLEAAVKVAARSASQTAELVKKAKADKVLAGNPNLKGMEAAAANAQEKLKLAEKKRNDLLDGPLVSPSFRKLVYQNLQQAIERNTLVSEVRRSEAFRKASPSIRESLDQRLKEYRSWGLGDPSEDPPRTAFARSRLAFYHARVLNDVVFGGSIKPIYQVHFVDPRISAPQPWHDVHRFDEKLGWLGWTRFDGATSKEFGPQGCLVLEKDKQGRCVLGRVVRYAQASSQGPAPNTNPLEARPTEEVIRIEYGPNDPAEGRIVERKKVPLE